MLTHNSTTEGVANPVLCARSPIL